MLRCSDENIEHYVSISAIKNWALNRPVAQSTTYDAGRFPPDSPVDGLFDKYSHSSHQNNNGYTWWLVYLERPVVIGYVVIYNVMGSTASRLSNKDVVVFDNGNRLENRRICGSTFSDMSTTAKITVTCSPPLLGQGVEIGKSGEHRLTLVEVEVYEF